MWNCSIPTRESTPVRTNALTFGTLAVSPSGVEYLWTPSTISDASRTFTSTPGGVRTAQFTSGRCRTEKHLFSDGPIGSMFSTRSALDITSAINSSRPTLENATATSLESGQMTATAQFSLNRARSMPCSSQTRNSPRSMVLTLPWWKLGQRITASFASATVPFGDPATRLRRSPVQALWVSESLKKRGVEDFFPLPRVSQLEFRRRAEWGLRFPLSYLDTSV